MTLAEVTRADPRKVHLARACVRDGRIAEAHAIYRDILKDAPDTPEALNFVAVCAMSSGQFAVAQRDLEHAAQLNPAEPEIWKNIGILHLKAHRNRDALGAFGQALNLDRGHVVSSLYRGVALEELGRVYEAATSFYGALAAAQSQGLWRDVATTPPDLIPVVTHAMGFVGAHRKRIFLHLLQPLRDRYGADALGRIERGLAIYLGEREAKYPDPRQRCRFFYVPGLRTTPYYDREWFPWQEVLEKQMRVIREELFAVLHDPMGVEPFYGTNDNEILSERKLLEGTRGPAEWNSFFFHRHGEIFERNSRRCPRTTEILQTLPLVHIRGHAPEVLFSILAAGSHILKHHGVTNTRLVTHVPLIIPEDCAISVGGIQHAWREGHCVTFDDTFEHEAWNHSDKVRVVMILDAWHPDLSEAERKAVALLVGGIGDFNDAARHAGGARSPSSTLLRQS